MKTKLPMLVMAAFAAVGVWGEDGRTIAFYPLPEAVAGETVSEMSFPNAAPDGTSYATTTGTMGGGDSVPVYSDEFLRLMGEVGTTILFR